ncbi:MAG: DoxX protein [Armatimonadetes bacterium]|nr:DoxX protein [Armatimonadota bacterium]
MIRKATAAIAILLATPAPALAHEKWFVDPSPYPLQLDPAAFRRTLLALAVVAAALGLAYLVERAWQRFRPVSAAATESSEAMRRLLAWIPLILALHIAVALMVSGVQRQYFAPNLILPRNLVGGMTALLEIVVALSFTYGALTRGGAAVLALLFPVGLLLFGVVDTLEHLELLGIGLFLVIFGRGPYALDAIFGSPARPSPRWVPLAVPLLRVLAGAAIVWLGFSEKLWNVQLGLAFLERHPFNFMPALGFPGFSNADFVVAAGLIEVAMGAVIASGLATRPVILLAWVPFNLTLPFLGWVELVGHLPMYAIMGVLLLWGSGKRAGLRP